MQFMRILLVSTAFLGLCFSTQAADKQPNIVFAFADDWGRYASAYAKLEPGGLSDIVSTPNFDRVANEGVLFTNAFVNAPSCTPCRSSLLSGQYFFRTGRGAILQGAVWDSKIPTYPLILAERGYHIGHSYKVWSPGTPRNAPYGAAKYAYNKRGNRFNGFSQFVSRAKDQATAKKTLYAEVRGNFEDFLEKRQKTQPFCYWWGPTNCHRKWTKGSGKAQWGMNPDNLKGKVPPFLPDVHVVRQDICDFMGEVRAFDAGLGVLISVLEQIGELDNTIIVVSGDHGIPGFPRGKCNLYDFGVAVPLAIRWGNGIAARGRVVSDFVNLPDLAPTFIEVAGGTAPDVMTGRSLLPILQSKKSGLTDASRDHVVVGRERHVARARLHQMPYPQRAIRTKDFLYIRNFKPERWPMGIGPGFGQPDGPMPSFEKLEQNTFVAFGDLDASPTKAWILTHPNGTANERYFDFAFGRRPAEELYDLRNDAHQIKNVAADPAYAKSREQLSTRLMSILKQHGDPRVEGDGTTFDKPPFAGASTQRNKNSSKRKNK